MRIFTIMLLIWYVVVRWIVLANTNQLSIEWLLNPASLFIAFVSIAYLAITLLSKIRDTGYYALTVGLFLFNAICVGLMSNDYLQDPSHINLFYVLSDVVIVIYYLIQLTICFQEQKVFFFNKKG